MSPGAEKRLLQLAILCALPLSVVVAIRSIAIGPGWIAGAGPVPVDLDSHFRYLSGIFLAMLVGYASCVPDVERKGARLRLLAALTLAGGLARAWSLVDTGVPSIGHRIGLGLELVVVPLIVIWQARVARRLA